MKDPYYWLREKENPDVLTYLKSENAYTKLMLSVTEFLQETLYKEFISRIKGDDTSAPIKKGKSNKETREIKRDSSCDSFLN
jgi:oligopeptidase B